MFAKFNHDPAAAHLVGYRPGGAGAGERVQYNILRIGGELQNSLYRVFLVWVSGMFRQRRQIKL